MNTELPEQLREFAVPYIYTSGFLVPPGTHTFQLGHDSGVLKEPRTSVAKLKETDAVKWIASDKQREKLFLDEILGHPHAPRMIINVKRNKVLGYEGGGDFDALVVCDENFRQAASFEFKTLPATVDGKDQSVRIKTKKLDELRNQCLERLEMGFYHTHMVILLKLDTSEWRAKDGSPNWGTSGMQTLRTYCEEQLLGAIPDDIGVSIAEILQFSRNPIGTAAGFGVKRIRVGRKHEQAEAISNSIKRIFQITERIRA